MTAKETLIVALAESAYGVVTEAHRHIANSIEALIDEQIKTALWENRLLGADEKHVKRADPEVEESLKELREGIAKLE